MKLEANVSRNRQFYLALTIGLFLLSVYLFTYRGGFHSVDEVSMFAVTENLVKFGRFNTDQIAWTQWTTSQAEAQGFFGRDGHVYSKKGAALSLAQAPLYLAALLAPGLGMLQAVSLLNAGVTAATAVLLYLLLTRMGFSPRTALITVLLFGLATISFVYAKYLFSEPLAGFLLLWTAYSLFVYRQQGGLFYTTMAGLAAGLAVLTRANNIFLAPIFGLYLSGVALRRARDTARPLAGSLLPPLVTFGLGAALVGAGLMGYNAVRSGNPLQTGYDLTLFSPNVLLGLYKLLFSPLRGLFVYSPLLLLSLPGWWYLLKRQPAEAWLFAGLAGVTVGLFSAWSSGEGLSWGSRFLVPLVPFLSLCLAPIVEIATGVEPSEAGQQPSPGMLYILRLALYALASLSFFIQILGIAMNPWVFLAQLQARFGGEFFLEKTDALYDFRYSQIVGQIQGWSLKNSDVAWWQPWGFDAPAFALSLALLLFCGWLVSRQVHEYRGRWLGTIDEAKPVKQEPPTSFFSAPIRFLTPGPPLVYVGLTGIIAVSYILLARYYVTDLQFGPPDDGYTLALNSAASRAGGADHIVTVAQNHYHVPMNRFKARIPIVGFARQTEPLPETALPLLTWAASGQSTWLATAGFQPAAADNPAEQWFSLNHFKASDQWFPDEVRLAEYNTGRPTLTRPINVTLGQVIQLAAVKVTESVQPGQSLPVALVWLPLIPPQADYHIFLHLLTGDGRLVAQHDGPPNGGYTPASAWPAGRQSVSRHAIPVPANVATGSYRLIGGLYQPATGKRLPAESGEDFLELGVIEVTDR